MKKLVISLIIIGVVVATPIALLYGFCFDNSKDPNTYNEIGDTSKITTDLVVRALNDTRTTKKIGLDITQQQLNDFLHATLTKENGIPTDTLTQTYVEIEGNKYTFNLGVSVPLFATKVKLSTTLSMDKDENGEAIFSFVIDDVKIGRLGGVADLGISIAKNFVTDDTLNSALSNSGVNMKVSLENKKITYKEADLITDINKLAAAQQVDSNGLLTSVMTDFFSEEFIDFNFDSSIQASVNLEPFAANDYGFFESSKEKNLDLDGCITKIKSLYSAGIIDSSHFEAVYQYLVYGYNNSGTECQEYVADKDFSSVGIADVKAYVGIVPYSNESLEDIIGVQNLSLVDLITTKQITFLSEAQVNEYISNKGFIGYSMVLADSTCENINYITVDNFYCNLYSKDGVGCLTLCAGLNFNGYETKVAFDMRTDDANTHDYQMGFKMDKIYMGNHVTSDTLSTYLFEMMTSCMQGDSTVKFNSDDMTIVIDFESSLSTETKTAVSLVGTPKMIIEGNGVNDDNGKVIARISD